jgi:hypothetical protein
MVKKQKIQDPLWVDPLLEQLNEVKALHLVEKKIKRKQKRKKIKKIEIFFTYKSFLRME